MVHGIGRAVKLAEALSPFTIRYIVNKDPLCAAQLTYTSAGIFNRTLDYPMMYALDFD